MQQYIDHEHEALRTKAKPEGQSQVVGQRQTAASHILQLQRTHGNAFVRRMLQREVGVDEMTTSVGNDASAGGGAGANSIGDGSATITAQNGVVNIDASMVNINAAVTQHSGVDKSETVITNSVVASSYTPGAGNIW